jgi:gentisate 1,2-dioxygenase
LPSDYQSEAHRHTSTVIYHVFERSGTTYHCDKRDSFIVPLWHAHRHINRSSKEAALFAMSDSPLLKSLHLYGKESASQ